MTINSLKANHINHSWAIRMANSVLPDYSSDKWQWHYEHGLLVKAIAEISAVTGDNSFISFAHKWVDSFVTPTGGIRTYQVEEYNLDQINPGKLLYPVYLRTSDDHYVRALHLLGEQLLHQPRNASGGFWHKKMYPFQMWLDGLYMSAPFYAEYAVTFNQPQLLDDVVHQFEIVEQHTRDPQTGLLYHGWDESKQQKWANPDTGCSPNFWGRAMGWYAMALVDVLGIIPQTHRGQPKLVKILNRLAQALLRMQDPTSGLWYQVVNFPGRPGNYLETSASAMLVYAFAKAVRKGYLTPDYQLAALRAYRGLLENKMKVDARGRLTLDGICSVGGLGGDPYRDGTYEYYISEPVAANDFKGVGPFILAALEVENSHTQDPA